MDSLSARKLIEKCFPEIQIKRARHILTGWENLVLEVNGEYVFRFPKFRETERRLQTEIELLPAIRRHLSTPVPDYEFVWKGNRNYPHWFGGYRKLGGVTLSKGLRREWNFQVAVEISRFLKELHKTRVQTRKLGVPRFSPEEWLKSTRHYHNLIRKSVYPLLDSDLRERSEALWKNLLADFAEADFVPTLIHGDLGTENILLDPATHRLTGILDWGYAQVGDPALEFAHLFINNPSLGKDILNRYGEFESSFERRVQWYVKTEPFYDILWGVTHRWKKAAKMGTATLMRVLADYA